jgi:hypothetical protein
VIQRWKAACNTHGREENAYKIWSKVPKERGHMEDLGVDGRIILKLILKI